MVCNFSLYFHQMIISSIKVCFRKHWCFYHWRIWWQLWFWESSTLSTNLSIYIAQKLVLNGRVLNNISAYTIKWQYISNYVQNSIFFFCRIRTKNCRKHLRHLPATIWNTATGRCLGSQQRYYERKVSKHNPLTTALHSFKMAFYTGGLSVGLSVNKWMPLAMPPCKPHLPHLCLLEQCTVCTVNSVHPCKTHLRHHTFCSALKFLAMPFSRLAFEAANEIRPHLSPTAGKTGQI